MNKLPSLFRVAVHGSNPLQPDDRGSAHALTFVAWCHASAQRLRPNLPQAGRTGLCLALPVAAAATAVEMGAYLGQRLGLNGPCEERCSSLAGCESLARAADWLSLGHCEQVLVVAPHCAEGMPRDTVPLCLILSGSHDRAGEPGLRAWFWGDQGATYGETEPKGTAKPRLRIEFCQTGEAGISSTGSSRQDSSQFADAAEELSRILAILGNELEAQRFQEVLLDLEGSLGQRCGLLFVLPKLAGPKAIEVERRGRATLNQAAAWFAAQWSPQSDAFHLPGALQLRGNWDFEVLEQSLTRLIQRHPALRTALVFEGDKLEQWVYRCPPLRIPCCDCRRLSHADFLDLAQRLARRPFDLGQARPIRFVLFERPEGRYLFWTVHHACFDGISSAILIRDLQVIYTHLLLGLGDGNPLAASMLEFAEWQHAYLRGVEADAHRAWWAQFLKDVTPLPTAMDRPNSAENPTRAVFESALDQASLTRLRACSKHARVSLYSLFLTAYLVVLRRFMAHEDLALVSPFAGRPAAQFQDVVGMFVNLVVLRQQLSAQSTLAQTMTATGRMVLAVLDHGYLPYEEVLRAANPQAQNTGLGPFGLCFVFQNWIPSSMGNIYGGSGESSVQAVDLVHETGGHALTLEVYVLADQVRLFWKYDSACFPLERVQEMVAAMTHLLTHFEENLSSPLGVLAPIVDQAQKFPPFQPLELLAARARMQPLHPAVVWGDQVFTYAEWVDRVGTLAQALRLRSVGPECLVALWAERTPASLAAMGALLWLGAAFLPLDPNVSLERNQQILKQSKCALLLASTDAARKLMDLEIEVMTLPSQTEAHYPPPQPTPDLAAAYVLYTSGSSGKPKGVVVSRRALASFVSAANQTYQLQPQDRLLQIASLCFDTAIEEIWTCFSSGATLVLSQHGAEEDLDPLLDDVVAESITVLDLPTALWHVWVHEPRFQQLPALRLIIIGGERAQPQAMRNHLASADAPQLWNTYGPTEATVVCCVWRAHRSWCDSAMAEVPLGEPLPQVALFCVDERLNQVGEDAKGELLIGGPGLARGYLAAAAETAFRFVPDPFSGGVGARLYRSGDRVGRARVNGKLLYYFDGRIDQQLKWRGYRLEPGELEAQLCSLAGVQAAVIGVHGGASTARLVAWVQTQESLEPRMLRQSLQRCLPAAMVPDDIVCLARFPMTVRGKLDIAALPAPLQAPGRVLRSSGLEAAILQEIWREVLGLAWIASDDHFFELGGHSLTATRVVMRIRQTLGRELSLRHFFEHAVFKDQVEFLRAAGRVEADSPIPPLRDPSVAPLSLAQERLYFLSRLSGAEQAYNVAFALSLDGPVCTYALEQAFMHLVLRHPALRSHFEDGDPPLQRVGSASPFRLVQVDLSSRVGAKGKAVRDRLALDFARRSFDLSQAPLWRLCLVRVADHSYVLMLNLHHLICDAWSIEILMQEWGLCYRAVLAGSPVELERLQLSYGAYAAWQRAQEANVSQENRVWWQARLADAPELLPLPLDGVRSQRPDSKGATVFLEVPEPEHGALRTLAQKQGVSLFSCLLTAWQLLLSRYTNSGDILVGCPLSRRPQPELESVFGFFVETLVLRTQLPPSPGPCFGQMIQHVHRDALEAFAHAGVPFEKLVEDQKLPRNLAHNPLFQVSFQHGYGADSTWIGGTRFGPAQLDFGLSPFDLSLHMMSRDGRLWGQLVYRTGLFAEATIQRMAEHLLNLLAHALRCPEQPVMRLNLSSPEERRLLLEVWSQNPLSYPRGSDMVQCFEASVQRCGLQEALRQDDQPLSYQQLNRAANRLGHYLRQVGVRQGTPVGICLRGGPNLVIAILAVLKAGGVYVPIEVDYPLERITFLSEDAGLECVISNERATFSFSRSIQVIEPEQVPEFFPDHNLTRVHPGGRAYICYTSGSTGKPKGVIVTHENILRLVYDTRYLRVASGDCVAQAANPAFDATTFEVWTSLVHGACLVHVDKHSLLQPRILAQLLRDQGITVIFLTTAVFNQCAREQPDMFAKLRYLLFGGEQVDVTLVARVMAHGRPQKLLHVYGPTESTTFSTWYEVNELEPWATNLAIGGPIANTTTWVLDRALEPVPPGICGDLFIGGAGLAEGYLGRPSQTAESFIPHPFADSPGERLYRSGDAVLQGKVSGALIFQGRIDNQVKIRGFRVEPAEVESHVRRCPGVRDTLVRAVQRPQLERYLVAYFVGNGCSEEDLRQFLEDRLPSYMVPALLIEVPEFPLNANGKLDWRALPAPENHRPAVRHAHVAPQSQLEEQILQVWRGLLGGVELGTRDNFFKLGAHSLMMARASARLWESLGLMLPIDVLFDHPSVAELARYIEIARWSRSAQQQGEEAEEEGLI